jgi:hypothetical protein
MRLLFHGFAPHIQRYQSSRQSEWPAGEVRDVEDEEAVGLLQDFGSAFTCADAPPVIPVVVPEPAVLGDGIDPVTRTEPHPEGTGKKSGKKRLATRTDW